MDPPETCGGAKLLISSPSSGGPKDDFPEKSSTNRRIVVENRHHPLCEPKKTISSNSVLVSNENKLKNQERQAQNAKN